ncbi:hypothetical protein JANAI62_15580 [Jannaschia pagri]|uniref:Uncharacterized protein n=1 Tax=Jannaschia pagri TaxID=2829797 RepID=A0ABQ4NL23_9RHOB|nr:hypothetical protein JANAI61_15610 [Jannaschia sp. AI_61]GIT94935.1 hypothetical protein JANAI62_15580 [Jannaschia sp. AI_62]
MPLRAARMARTKAPAPTRIAAKANGSMPSNTPARVKRELAARKHMARAERAIKRMATD